MAEKGRRVAIKDVAAAAGVSSATVSLALRNDPRIAASTTGKVRKAAEELGYVPDPHLSQLMGYLQKGKAHGEGSVIALLTDFPEKELRAHAYLSQTVAGIEERCATLGYRVDVFSVGRGYSLKRIHQILDARGVFGLIVLPFRERLFSLDAFDFSRLSAVAVGYGLESPLLHRAASQQTLAAMRVAGTVLERGYRRVGMVISPEIDVRTQHRYLAGFLGRTAAVVNGESAGSVPPLLVEKLEPDELKEWLDHYKADALVSSHREVPEGLDALRIRPGKDIGLAMIDYPGERPLARMQVPYRSVGKAAVNLVHGMLAIHERGLPAEPSVLTVPGLWVDGPSLPQRTKLKGSAPSRRPRKRTSKGKPREK